nr:hypothetical protein [Burkholderiales bacterium]
MSEHETRRVEPHGFRQLDPLPSDSALSEFYESRYYDLLRQGGRAPEIRRLMTPGPVRDTELEWLGATLHRDIADYVRECSIPSG